MEKADLQEALGQKEAAERDLVAQLERLSQQLQRAARQRAELEEENAGLWRQKEEAAAEAQAREAGRRLAGACVPGRRGGAAGCRRLPCVLFFVPLKARTSGRLVSSSSSCCDETHGLGGS